MSGKKQVWYVEGSAAAKLAAPLRTRYDLHSVPQNKKNLLPNTPSAGASGAPAVWLADAKASREILRARAGQLGDNCRIIAVFSANDSSGAKAGRSRNLSNHESVFAFLPSFAPRSIV
ncbi:MAG TPA: hypothetical protein VHN10_11585, partial [Candidatus Acidoferrales bacterium]|nr:hypothetical protein [Candidatus Acidoferrales bacterium]